MLLSELLYGIDLYSESIPNVDIKKVTAKINMIEKECLFILLKRINSSNVIKNIKEKAPSVIITDLEDNFEWKIPIVRVKNARLAYAHIMWNFSRIDLNKIDFFGITGTNGKTTTASILYNIFKFANVKCGFIGTGKILINGKSIAKKNYSMTTPDPEELYPIIKRMELEGCKSIVMEISSHSLALFKVAPIRFKCSVFTNLSPEHMDFHGSIDEYYKAKKSLFYQSRYSVFNLDDPYSDKARRECAEFTQAYGVGIKSDADAMAKDVSLFGLFGSSYIYREKNIIFKNTISLVGEFNISNSLLAIKCAIIAGVPIEIIQNSFKTLNGIDGRFELIHDSPMIIIDYAHTEKAMENLLVFVNTAKKQEQKVISVFGCGGDRDKEKRPKMARIAERLSDFVIVTSDNSRTESTKKIVNEIEIGFKDKSNYTVIENRADAINHAVKCANNSDIVLIIGKGHERYNIDSLGYHKFDERKIIMKALKERQKN